MEFIFDNRMGQQYDEYEIIFNDLLVKTLRYLGITDEVVVEITLVDADTIRTLNRDYRHIDAVTDVISFAFSDEVTGETAIKNVPFHDLGAIVIATPSAEAQAREFGHGIERELSFLFVHGLLHLLGYDHMTPVDETRMIALQDAIIGKRSIT